MTSASAVSEAVPAQAVSPRGRFFTTPTFHYETLRNAGLRESTRQRTQRDHTDSRSAILGNRDGEVLDDPGSFKTKEESKLSVLEHILQPDLYPELYGKICHKVRINYYPPRGDNKEGWDNIDIFGWLG